MKALQALTNSIQAFMLKIRAYLHFQHGIGDRPLAHPEIENIIHWNRGRKLHPNLMIDNIVYWGGPLNMVKVLFRTQDGTPIKEQKIIWLVDKSHYDIVTLFKYAYDNRTLVESHDGFETNMSLVGEPTDDPSNDKYPHPLLIKIKHPSGSCYVKPVKYKIFQIDII